MAQLFKAKTIQQFQIMQWLAEQGIANDDIASAKLVSRSVVRVTNPTGQYMDVFCAMNGTVRILQVSEEREADLDREWNQCDLMDEEDYYEWYGNLTDDERALIDAWDEAYCSGVRRLCEDVLTAEQRRNAYDKISNDKEKV
ncbi:MAG: hypothetical protein ACI3V2_09720 [Faecousia sp.]